MKKEIKGTWRPFKGSVPTDGEYVVCWSAGRLDTNSVLNGYWLKSGIAGANKMVAWLDMDTPLEEVLEEMTP